VASGGAGNLSRSQAIRDLLMRGLSAAYKEREQVARKAKEHPNRRSTRDEGPEARRLAER